MCLCIASDLISKLILRRLSVFREYVGPRRGPPSARDSGAHRGIHVWSSATWIARLPVIVAFHSPRRRRGPPAHVSRGSADVGEPMDQVLLISTIVLYDPGDDLSRSSLSLGVLDRRTFNNYGTKNAVKETTDTRRRRPRIKGGSLARNLKNGLSSRISFFMKKPRRFCVALHKCASSFCFENLRVRYLPRSAGVTLSPAVRSLARRLAPAVLRPHFRAICLNALRIASLGIGRAGVAPSVSKRSRKRTGDASPPWISVAFSRA